MFCFRETRAIFEAPDNYLFFVLVYSYLKSDHYIMLTPTVHFQLRVEII